MKTDFKLRNILMAMLVMVMGVAVSACSKDDDEPGNALVGTWYVVSIDGESVDNEAYEFKADGTFVRIKLYNGEVHEITTNHAYTVSGDFLRMDYSIENGLPDDYTIGKFQIKDNILTYVRTWHDGWGEWSDDEAETIVMRRK